MEGEGARDGKRSVNSTVERGEGKRGCTKAETSRLDPRRCLWTAGGNYPGDPQPPGISQGPAWGGGGTNPDQPYHRGIKRRPPHQDRYPEGETDRSYEEDLSVSPSG